MWIVGDFSACIVILSIIILIFFNYGFYNGMIINIPLIILFSFILYLGFGRFPDLKKSRNLLNEIMKEEKKDIKIIKEEWFNGEKNMTKDRFLKYFPNSFYFISVFINTIGIIFLILGAYTFGSKSNEIVLTGASILMTFGIGCFSLGFAFLSIGIAKESDKKMIALAELNFVEKNATILSYIRIKEDLNNDDIRRIIRDLEAAFKVENWVDNKITMKNFIDSLIELTGILLDKNILQTIEPSFKNDYKKILESSKKYKHRIDEIEVLQNKF